MLELEELLKRIGGHLKKSRKGFNVGREEFRSAENFYREASQLRDRILKDSLEEKGLAICSAGHQIDEGVEESSAEQLGIYPRGQMRLHFYRSTLHEIEMGHEQVYDRTVRLSLYCPEHFPANPDRISLPESDDPVVYSEVVRQDRQFILTVNGGDITRLVNKGGINIEPDGSRYPSDRIYRHFGIPDLPELDYNKARGV